MFLCSDCCVKGDEGYLGGVLNWVFVPSVVAAGVRDVVAYLLVARIVIGLCLVWWRGLVDLDEWRLGVIFAEELV